MVKKLAEVKGLQILYHPDILNRDKIRSRAQRYAFIAKSSGFTGWLMEQVGRGDPVADLASDCQFDALWPHDLDNIDDAKRLFDSYCMMGDEGPALDALERAWGEYLLHGGGRTTWPTSPDEWVRERCGGTSGTPVAALYDDYCRWCRDRRYVALSMKSWSTRLTELGHKSKNARRFGRIVLIKPLDLKENNDEQ